MKLLLINKEAVEKKLIRHRIILDNNCWIWTGSIDKNGYGRLGIEEKMYLVHRLSAYIWLDLDVTKSYPLVLHKNNCHNTKCFNPEHLYKGNTFDNGKDTSELGNRKKSHCNLGHELKDPNLYYRKDGQRDCKLCAQINYLSREGI